MSQTGWVPDSDQQSGWVPDKPSGPAIAPKPTITAPQLKDFRPNGETLGNFGGGLLAGTQQIGSGLYNTIAHPIDTAKGIVGNLGNDARDTYKAIESTKGEPAWRRVADPMLDVATGVARLPVAGFDEPQLAREWSAGGGARAIGESMPTATIDALAAEHAAGRGKLEVRGKPVVQSVKETAQNAVYNDEGKMRPIARTGARIAGAGAGHAIGIPEGGLIGALAGPEALKAIVPPPEIPEPELGTPENPGWVAKLPLRMPRKLADGGATIREPADAAPRFVGSEGRPATWTNERVMELASKGDRQAIAQAVRRGFKLPDNVRYVMGDTDYPRSVYNPRDVTKFSPEGVPIRQGGTRLIGVPQQ